MTIARTRRLRSWSIQALIVVVAAVTVISVGAARAASPACQTSSPSGGTYSVTVCLTTPLTGAVTGDTVVTATASTSGTTPPGTQRAVFYLDGQYLLTDYSNPYTFVLPTNRFVDGTHLLEVETLMRDGFTSSRAGVSLQFQNGVKVPPVNTKHFTPTTGTTPPSGQPIVLAAAGDGAGGEQGETDVVNLIQSWNPNLFLYLGDVYEKGSMAEFYNWYGPNSLFGGLRPITDPTIGNHEYTAGQAPGYFDYWDNAPHYYSINAGNWHIVSLDSTSQGGGTKTTSAQYQWLAGDLRSNTRACTLVYYHHPVYNIGQEGYYTSFASVWSLLAQYHVTVVLNGHDHTYQRWVPLNGSGSPASGGVTELVVGTGGHSAGAFVTTDSRVAASATGFGALQLTLNSGGAGYAFESTAHTVVDSGSIPCATAHDTTPPSTPTGLSGSAVSATEIDLKWNAAADNVGVTGYDVFRNGALLASLQLQESYADTSALPGTSYSYQVRARDAAGNISGLSTPAVVATPSSGSLFQDGFESGNLSKWSTVNGLVVQNAQVLTGSWAAEAAGTNAAAYAWENLTTPRTELYANLHFKVLSQGANSIYLARLRTATGTPLVTLYVSSTGKVGYRNEVAGVSNTSTAAAASGTWHSAQLHVIVQGDTSTVEIWLDGVKVNGLPTSASLGTTAIGRVELGDSATNQTYDVAYDDVSFDPGQTADTTPPTTPGGLTATAASAFEVDLSWSASTDAVGVAGYTVYRNGVEVGQTDASTTSFADTSTQPLTSYYYTVTASDTSGNSSAPAGPVGLTTPGLFSDDFESGDLSRWTTVNGLVVQQDDVHAGIGGARAASTGSPASASVTFPQPVASLDARVEFNVESESTNVTLLRFRTAGNGAIVSVYVSSTGKLGVRNDVTGVATTDTSTPVAPGVWHLLELDATASDPSSTIAVLLDGVQVAALSGPATLGTSPIGRLELGEAASNRTFSVAFDDVLADTSFAADTTPPAAPTSLTATASAGGTSLAWSPSNDNVGVTGYRVIRDGAPLADTTATSFEDTTANQTASHAYAVKAFDAAGNLSDPSNTATTTGKDTTPPTTPGGLAGSAPSPTRVDLTWSPSTDNVGVDHYVVLRGGTKIGQTTGATTAYSDLTVAGWTTYAYQVEAVDAAGNTSGPSSVVTIKTPDGTPPTAPPRVRASQGFGNSVRVTWNASTDNVGVTAYNVYRNGIRLATLTSRSYTDSSVARRTTYSYTVTALDAAGNESAPGGPSTLRTR